VDHLQLTIPARDKTLVMKIRPRQVREWLDNLPYLDPERAARLASQQLRLMNRQPLAAGARLETLGDFLAAYHRLGESLPAGAADAEAARQRLKRLCQDMGFGYKIVVHELASARARLLEGRNLSLGLVGAMHTLGMQLMHYYGSYQRAPRSLWNECLALYRYARKRGRHTGHASLPGLGEIQLEAVFSQIALLQHANPYGLAPGMALALQRYLGMHAPLAVLDTEATTPDNAPCIQLAAQQQPPAGLAAQTLRLHLGDLLKQLATDIGTLQRHRQARSIGLPGEVPATVLLQTLQQLHELWSSPRERSKERARAHATIELVTGLDAAYCVLNNERHFDPALFLASGHDEVIDLGRRPARERAAQQPPARMPCLSLNRSTGGVALSYRGETQAAAPRVGQLVAVRRAGSANPAGWVLAVCRWLQQAEAGAGFELGLQYLAREARPVVIRPLIAGDGYHQPALATRQQRGDESLQTLIVHAGALQAGASVTVYDQGRQYALRCVELMEAGCGFERFACLPAD